MSLDLIVMPRRSAPTFEEGFARYLEAEEGAPPETAPEGVLSEFAAEVRARYDDRGDWPWTSSMLVYPSHVSFVIAHERWEEVVPEIVRLAHQRNLVVLDPQAEEAFAPGTPYEF